MYRFVSLKKLFQELQCHLQKMFESFAMGVPFICNKGIGDVDHIINNIKLEQLSILKKVK